MDKLSKMHEEIGTVKWFGDSTKQTPHSDYGYITRTENPEKADIKVYWKNLDCFVNDIKGQKGLLVHFNIGNYKGKEEAINVYPVQAMGYIEKLSYDNHTSYRVVLDTSLAIGEKVEKILRFNKEELKKHNIYNPQEILASNFFRSLLINKNEKQDIEYRLKANSVVLFQIKRNNKSDEYEAVNISFLEDENDLSVLDNYMHSQNHMVWLTAFRRYLSIVPDKEAVKFAQTKINDIRLLNIPVSKNMFFPQILYLDIAKPLREILDLNEQLEICLERVADSESATNKEVLDELLDVIKEIKKLNKDALWEKISEKLIKAKVNYKGMIFEFVPDLFKYKIVAKYLEDNSEVESVKIANETLKNLKNDSHKKDFVSLIYQNFKSRNLISRLDASHFRQMLPVESRLSIYQSMMNIYTINELLQNKIEEEIITTLHDISVYNRESWLNKVESKIVYKGFLWQVATDEIKKRVIKTQFAPFLNAVEIFKKGYPYQENIRANAKDIYSIINEKDKELAKTWMSSDAEFYEQVLAKMLSARGAERFAIKVYKSFGFEVEDISIKQLDKQGDWQSHDLLLDNKISVDIKNARQAGYTLDKDFENKYKYSEFCVPRFKLNRSSNEVIIAGVFSPHLNLEYITSPTKIYFQIPRLTFIGEIKESELKAIEKHFSKYFDAITVPRGSEEKYLPPWLFDYPVDKFYFQQEQAIKQLRELESSQLPDWDAIEMLNINPFPLCLAAKVFLPNSWNTCLKMWEQVFISRLQEILAPRITLPYLFLTILAHFIDMLRRKDNSFHPSKYSRLLYNKHQSHPLGIYDPLQTIKELCETLSLLWEHTSNNQILISQFRIFKFDAKGLLRGKTNINDNLKTIIAYCGGYIKEKGYCGFSPLIFGQQSTCPKCGYLICSNKKCGYCKCKRKV